VDEVEEEATTSLKPSEDPGLLVVVVRADVVPEELPDIEIVANNGLDANV
jgi:hypothetical protein